MRKLYGVIFLAMFAACEGTSVDDTDATAANQPNIPHQDAGPGADTMVLCDNNQTRVIDEAGVHCVDNGTDAGVARDAATGNDSASEVNCGSGWFYAVCQYWTGCLPNGALCPDGTTPTNDAGHTTNDAGHHQDSGNTDSTFIPTCNPGCVVIFDPSDGDYSCLCFAQDAGTPDANVDCPAHSHQHGNYCVCDNGYYQVVVNNDVVCRAVTSDAGTTTDAAAATCPAHSHRLDDFCVCDNGYVTVVINNQVVCQLPAGSDAGTANDAATSDATVDGCPAHSHRIDGFCWCDNGYSNQLVNGLPACVPNPGTTVCNDPDAVALEGGWCAIQTDDAPTTPSGGPCNGDKMCVLDRHGPWSSTPDGLAETFCVFTGPMSQKAQGYPLNYHTDFPSSVDIVDLFGDYYAALPGLIYVDQGPMGALPVGRDRETYVEDDYMCFDFTGHLNGQYYFNFVSMYDNGLYVINDTSPDGCIVLMQNGSDYRGFCPADRTQPDRFVWLHNDLICNGAAAGSLESRVCQLRDDGNYMFGLLYQNTRGLNTLY